MTWHAVHDEQPDPISNFFGSSYILETCDHPTRNAELSDSELVAAAHSGSVGALGILLERQRPRLLATALFMLGVQPDAEHAVPETFLIALQRVRDVRDPSAVGAWLQTVVRRLCL